MPRDIQKQLEESKSYVDENFNPLEDFTAAGFPDLDPKSISDAIGALCVTISQYPLENISLDKVSLSYLRQKSTELKTNIEKLLSTPTTHIPSVLSIVESLKSTTERLSGYTTFREDVNSIMTDKLAISLSKLSDSDKLHGEILTANKSANENFEEINDLLQKSKTHLANIEEFSEEITEEKDASRNLLKKIKIYSATSKALSEKFTTLKSELEESAKTQEKLFEEFERYRDRVNDLLGDASRTGMAASFIARKKELVAPTWIWAGVFIASIAGLSVVAYNYIAPALTSGQWEQILFRIPITAPIIWLGWFSAKQYGYNTRLLEDYAYKAATSMAFEGYKREAKDLNTDLNNKLLDNAIDHFSKNPLRIYEKENHASPVSEMLQQCLKNDKLIDLAKQVMDKIKQ